MPIKTKQRFTLSFVCRLLLFSSIGLITSGCPIMMVPMMGNMGGMGSMSDAPQTPAPQAPVMKSDDKLQGNVSNFAPYDPH